MPKTKSSLLPSCGLFSSRDTLEEALAYANELILTQVPAGAPRQAALTALHVTSNTAIKLLESVLSPLPQEPADDTLGKDYTLSENLWMLKRALPSLAIIAFSFRRIDPTVSDCLGALTAVIGQMTGTSVETLVSEITKPRS